MAIHSVFLPGKSLGQRSLEAIVTEWTQLRGKQQQHKRPRVCIINRRHILNIHKVLGARPRSISFYLHHNPGGSTHRRRAGLGKVKILTQVLTAGFW